VKTTNEYKVMKEKHQEEINEFPMFFAFSKEQFEKGMTNFGLQADDVGEISRLGDTGGFIKRTDAAMFREMSNRHEQEMQAAIDNDTTGEGFIFDMFFYELANHEYVYTNDVTDTLEALSTTEAQVNLSDKLRHGLEKAINALCVEDSGD
jgi:hypothetical protein